MIRRASQKYGTEEKKLVMGMSRSAHPPRRHPARMPATVPRTNPMTVEMPTSVTVHGNDCSMTVETGVGK